MGQGEREGGEGEGQLDGGREVWMKRGREGERDWVLVNETNNVVSQQ